MAHAAIEPGIGAGLGWPCLFDEPAQHHAVDRDETRLEQAENLHAAAQDGRRPDHAIGDRRAKQLRIVRGRDHHLGGCGLIDDLVEAGIERGPVRAGERRDRSRFVSAERRHDLAVAGGERAQRMRS